MRGRFSKGSIPWNKGIPMREEAKQKLSGSKRGTITWNKGLSTGPLSEETRQKISTALKGRETTPEHRANLSKALKGREITWDLHSSASSLTWKLADFLSKVGFEIVLPEARVGRYTVDVLLAQEWIAFEADGNYWHSDKVLSRKGFNPNRLSDAERDEKILDGFDLPIVRLTEDEVNSLHKEVT